MKQKKKLAIQLRKDGNSYSQITKEIGVVKSTLSYWLKDIEISEKAKKKISERSYERSTLKLIQRNKRQTILAKERVEEIKLIGENEFKIFAKDDLFIIGVSLYWAEGYKKGAYGSKWKVVDFVNSDEEMIILMMKFFRKYFKEYEEKFKIQIIVHPNVNIDKAVIRWSEVTGLTKDKFIKTCAKLNKSSKGIRNKKSLPFGTAHIRIYNVKCFLVN